MTQPMNNPMVLLISAMRNGGNPRTLVQQMAQRDPRMRQAMQLLNGKNPAQQRQFVMNMAKDRGVDLEDLARSMGIQIPSER